MYTSAPEAALSSCVDLEYLSASCSKTPRCLAFEATNCFRTPGGYMADHYPLEPGIHQTPEGMWKGRCSLSCFLAFTMGWTLKVGNESKSIR